MNSRKSTKWWATQDKGASVKSQILPALVSFLAHEMNSFELLETPLSDQNGRHSGLDWGKGRALRWRQAGVWPDGDSLGTVRKLCQKCNELLEKGLHD